MEASPIPITRCVISDNSTPDWARKDGMKLVEFEMPRDMAKVLNPDTKLLEATTVHVHTYMILPETNNP